MEDGPGGPWEVGGSGGLALLLGTGRMALPPSSPALALVMTSPADGSLPLWSAALPWRRQHGHRVHCPRGRVSQLSITNTAHPRRT